MYRILIKRLDLCIEYYNMFIFLTNCQRLGGQMENLTRCWMWTLSAVVVNAVTTPYFLCAAVPFFIAFYFLQRFFRTTARYFVLRTSQ